MSLFEKRDVELHSGSQSDWIIDCTALYDSDFECLAYLASKILPPFGSVEGVPDGGLRFADKLRQYITEGPVLIADDVLTTGNSMEEQRAGRKPALGIVIFARKKPEQYWISYLFTR